MATKEKILEILSGGDVLDSHQISEKLGEPTSNFVTQLNRMEKMDPPWVEKNEDKQYTITEAGKAAFANGGETPGVKSQVEMGATEQDLFETYGKQIGAGSVDLIKSLSTYVFNGDFKNLTYVWECLDKFHIKRELADRWFLMWQSHLKVQIPEALRGLVNSPESDKEGKGGGLGPPPGEVSRQHLTHSLDENDNPMWMGPGMGDMTEKDAIDLAKTKAMARSRGAAAGARTAGSQADDIVAIVKAIRELNAGDGSTPPKSYIVKPGPDGAMVAEELDPSKPNIVNSTPAGAAPAAQKTLIAITKEDGSIELVPLDPTKPIVIPGARPAAKSTGKTILIDRATGEKEEVNNDQPIIIFKNQPTAGNPTAPVLQFKDKDGNPMTLDIDTYFRLEDHKIKREQEQQKHEMSMDLIKTIKDLAAKGAKAAERIATRGDNV